VEIIGVVAIGVGFLQCVALICTFMIMRETSIKQLRAYITVSAGPLEQFVADKPVVTMIMLDNMGATPARDMFHISGFATSTAEAGVSFERLNWRKARKITNKTFIIPKASKIRKESPESLPREQFDRVMVAKDRLVFVYGTIFYRDIFGYHRTTRFCMRYSGGQGSGGEYHDTDNEAT